MQTVITVGLLIVLALAMRFDMLAHRIPNALTGVGVGAGLLLHSFNGGAPAMLTSLAGIAVGIAVMLPFYLLRGMGAGDVKLMGAVGGFLGPQAVVFAAAATLAIGAFLALGFVASRLLARSHLAPKPILPGLDAERPASVSSLRKEKFPYALAIAGGSLVSLWKFGQLEALVGLVSGWTAA